MAFGDRRITIDVLTRWRNRGELRQAARDLDSTAKSATRAGDAMDDTGRSTEDLDVKIRQLRGTVRDLGDEWARTEDKITKSKLREARSRLAMLRSIQRERQRDLAIAARDSDSGGLLGGGDDRRGGKSLSKFGKGTFGGIVDFSSVVAESRGVLIVALVGAITAASPAIGAVIAGAVTGAVGAGGIIGGVVAASTDPQVRQAWSDLAATIDADDFGAQIFKGPTLEVIRELRSAFHDLDLAEVLAPLAPLAPVLAKGFGDFARAMVKGGLAEALENAGPFIEALAHDLPAVGDALGYMLKKMSESEGAVEGLRFLMALLTATLNGLGNVVDWLARRFDQLLTSLIVISGALEDAHGLLLGGGAESWRRLNDNLEQIRAETRGFGVDADAARAAFLAAGTQGVDPFTGYMIAAGDATADTGRRIRSLSMDLDEMFGKLMGADRAAIAWEEALDNLAQSVADNGKGLDIQTEKGRANTNALLGMVDAAKDARDANIELGRSAEEADREYARQIDRIKWHAYYLGLDKEAVDAIVGKYEVVIVYRTQGQVPKGFRGYQGAPSFAELESARTRAGYNGPTQIVPGFAGGGTTPAFAPFRVHDGEVLYSSRQHYVATAAQADAMRVAPSGAGRPMVVQVVVGGHVVREAQIDEALARGVPDEAIRVAYP